MGTQTVLRSRFPRLTRGLQWPTDQLGRLGDHMLFYLRALGGVPHATVHFRREIVRLIAEISMGAGTLAMIGGTVVIVGFLTLAAGGTLAVQGYSSLGDIGIEALTGFLAAFINVRISAPVVAGIGLAATFGAGCDRPAGRDAHQRGDRRARGDGDPPDRIPGLHPDRRGDDRDHPAVLDRGGPVVSGVAVHHRGAVRAVGWAV